MPQYWYLELYIPSTLPDDVFHSPSLSNPSVVDDRCVQQKRVSSLLVFGFFFEHHFRYSGDEQCCICGSQSRLAEQKKKQGHLSESLAFLRWETLAEFERSA